MSEYCLRWNNHQPNFVKVFSDLLTTEALVDVTLATDGHFIQAHQLVLSACSVYFRDLFMTNPCRHPIVILKDIRIEDLKTVIDFIYRGEVNVCQERLPDVLKVAGSLRIKGLAENQQTVEEIPSHAGYRPRQQASSSSSVRNDLQSSSQRSSLTDSRELSLSVEGDDQEGAATPPPSKKRKASSQESSESCPDVPEEKPRLTDVKEEPRDDRENDRSHSQETESEYNVGGNGEADDSSSSGIGVSASAGGNSSGGEGASLIPQSQGRNKRGLLQRQTGIVREVVTEEKYSNEPDLIIPEAISITPASSTTVYQSQQSHPCPSSSVTLLQVPPMVMGHREGSFGSSNPPHLSKQSTQSQAPSSGPTLITKQISHPEASIPRSLSIHSQGPPPMPKQRSHPGVLTHTTSFSSENIPPASKSSELHYQIVPVQIVPKQKSISSSNIGQHLRPIQPKPDGEVVTIKKDLPMIRLTPSDDSNIHSHPPHRQTHRALSEEPRHFLDTSSSEMLSPAGPSPLVQSVSQDSVLDSGASMRFSHSLNVNASTVGLTQSTPGHCPVLREGPALGCNFCWNSSDSHGRVLRRKTKYHCPECRTNLCIVPCFHEYHKQIERQMDTHKQITKILDKTKF